MFHFTWAPLPDCDLISFLISSLSLAALFTSSCLKDSVNNNDRESIIILLHRASCSRLTSQQVGLRRFNIPTRIARCISHGLGFIIPTSQKCSEPFQIIWPSDTCVEDWARETCDTSGSWGEGREHCHTVSHVGGRGWDSGVTAR